MRPHPFLLALLVTGTVCLSSSADARQNSILDPADEEDVKACSVVKGPFNDGKETYFEAANNCREPLHCRVWVNYEEPPMQIHLEPGTRGRIDLGRTLPDDKYASDCIATAI